MNMVPLIFALVMLANIVSYVMVIDQANLDSTAPLLFPLGLFDLAGVPRITVLAMMIPLVNLGVAVYLFFLVARRFGIAPRAALPLAITLFGLFPYIAIRKLEYKP